MKKRISILAFALLASACGSPQPTPAGEVSQREQDQLDDAAEMLDKSDKGVVKGATRPE